MFCPECRTEYIKGISICDDCGAQLVEELPPKNNHKCPPYEVFFPDSAAIPSTISSEQGKMFCPECRTEYREGFTVCSDCGRTLVSELLPEPPTEISSEGDEFEEVFGFMDEGVVAIVKSLLDEEGIDYHIVGVFTVSSGPDRKLMIRKDQVERAREILEDLELDKEEPDAIA